MTIGLVHTTLNSLSYSAATAIIRYVYVRSSLQVDIQDVLKRNAFILKAILIVESIGLINLYSFYTLQKGKSGVERLPLLIYQTCLDPWSKHKPSSMPVVYVILTQTADLCIICFNLYLYRYLSNRSRENTGGYNSILTIKCKIYCVCVLALSAADKLKARRRNLISAKVGFYSFIFMIIYHPILVLLYILPVEVGRW